MNLEKIRKADKKQYFLLIGFIVLLGWSAIKPHDYFTWFLEIFPAIIGLVILIATYKKFRFSNLLYFLMFLHAAVLIVGGHYTYAEVPIGNWVKDFFDLSRNHYDRLGHLMQGFVPALIIREIVIRKQVISGKKWQFFFIASACLAISACYEFIEWWVAVGTGAAADSFLGTQGDVWDTQWDMFLALMGAVIALTFMKNIHDRALKRINAGS